MKRRNPRPKRYSPAAVTARRWWVWLLFAVPPLALIAAVCDAAFPLGVPGEWTWHRSNDWLLASCAIVPALIVGAGYLGLVLAGAQRFCRPGSRETGGWLNGLFAAGLLWVVTLQAFAPFCCGLEKAGIVNYYRCNSGYFARAKLAERDLRTFLGAYERGISTRTARRTFATGHCPTGNGWGTSGPIRPG